MKNAIAEIAQSYEKKIVALQQQIDKLRAKKDSMISSLQEDIGDIEINPPTVENKQSPVNGEQAKEMTTRERLIQALDRMPPSGFGTLELIESVNRDGKGGEVNRNRSLKLLKNLIDEGTVKVKIKRFGKKGGIYQKVIKEQEPHGAPAKFTSSPVGEGSLL